MTERLIIAAFAIGSIGVHWLIYLWVKFKIDEGVIINLFAELHANRALSTQELSTLADIKISRVAEVCKKSKKIKPYFDRNDIWCLEQQTKLRA